MAEIDEPHGDRGTFDWDRFGRMLLYYRNKNGLRLEDMSRLSGVPLTSLSNLEKGRPAILENVLPLCVVMKINPCKLHSKWVSDKPEPPAPPSALDLLPPTTNDGVVIGGDGLPSTT